MRSYWERGRPGRPDKEGAGSPRSRSKPSHLSAVRRGGRRQIEFRNLGAGGVPDALMATDVFERSVECPDAVGHAADIGVQRDRKHAAGIGALAVQHIEGTADHVAKLA